MKYNLIPSGSVDNLISIYVLPVFSEGASYSIAYPDFSVEDILAGNINIRIFEGCSSNALEEIETKLKERLQKKYEKYAERINTFFTTGVVVFILGIINWVIPDPLPLVDELVFTIGGGLTVWKAWNDRKLKLPLLMEQIYRYNYEGVKPELETDSFLTLIFKSIRCKIDPLAADEQIDGMDSIEIESLWMTKYLNIQDYILSGEIDKFQLKEIISVILTVFPLKKIVKLEGIKQRARVRIRLRDLKEAIVQKTGITQDALAVYVEFYKAFINFSAK